MAHVGKLAPLPRSHAGTCLRRCAAQRGAMRRAARRKSPMSAPMSIHVVPCRPMSTHVDRCRSMSTDVDRCRSMSIDVVTSLNRHWPLAAHIGPCRQARAPPSEPCRHMSTALRRAARRNAPRCAAQVPNVGPHVDPCRPMSAHVDPCRSMSIDVDRCRSMSVHVDTSPCRLRHRLRPRRCRGRHVRVLSTSTTTSTTTLDDIDDDVEGTRPCRRRHRLCPRRCR